MEYRGHNGYEVGHFLGHNGTLEIDIPANDTSVYINKYLYENNLLLDLVIYLCEKLPIYSAQNFSSKEEAIKKLGEPIYYKGKTFYLDKVQRKTSNDETVIAVKNIYVETYNGIITDDENFIWRKDYKDRYLKSTIRRENFEFAIKYEKRTKTTYIDAKYIKCENRHRNKVTVDEIIVTNADNESILKAINKWIRLFKKEVNEVEEICVA